MALKIYKKLNQWSTQNCRVLLSAMTKSAKIFGIPKKKTNPKLTLPYINICLIMNADVTTTNFL